MTKQSVRFRLEFSGYNVRPYNRWDFPMNHNPNRKPFPRGSFFSKVARLPDVHIRIRNANEDYFRGRNEKGYQHDLGAQDCFLDNLGIAIEEQFEDVSDRRRYLEAVQLFLDHWDSASEIPIHDLPWWGIYLNAFTRRAAAGEPRSLLRLMPEDLASVAGPSKSPAPSHRFSDWLDYASDELFERRLDEGPGLSWTPPPARATGIPLPSHMQKPVSELRILHPRHSTPDLPPRVGIARSADRKAIRAVLKNRDQGALGTCASFATCFALEVAALRAGNPHCSLSPAWLHLVTGDLAREGRSLQEMVDAIECEGLPCREQNAPYPLMISGDLSRRSDLSDTAIQDSIDIGKRYGSPSIQKIDFQDISRMKAVLAAGWVVLAATRLTDRFQLRRGAMEFGLPLLPLPGEAADSGHGWCIAGYDHVDGGTHHWKYQGRFVALNSWGEEVHAASPYGPGTVSLPFAFVQQEGFEAFALRFQRNA